MKKLKLLSVILAMVLVFGSTLTGCKKGKPSAHTHTWGEWETVTEPTCTSNGFKRRSCSCGEVQSEPINAIGHNWENGICKNGCGAIKPFAVKGLEYGKDYQSLYAQFGSDVTIADVKDDIDESGRHNPYIVRDNVKYKLGLDFLSMAMVYNTKVPAGSEEYKTENDVYAKWWMYYIERWNELLPELPLYSNEYYDLYNTQITGVKEHPTNPYWGVADALIDWDSTKTDKSIFIGNTTDLSGKFRYPVFGASQPGAADYDVSKLVSGLETVVANKDGGYQWNDTVVKSHKEELNADGTKTFTVEIKDNLKFSDGSAITAKNYVVSALVFSSPVGKEAAKKDHTAGLSYVGFNAFNKYDGTNDGADGASKYFSGIKLLGDYTYSVTVTKDYANYFYGVAQAGFGPEYLAAWLGDADVIVGEDKSVGLSDSFYAKSGDSFAKAAHIYSTAMDVDKQLVTAYPYSGAYVVKSYDKTKKEAVLEKNPNFVGNYEGATPKILKVVYSKIVSETQLASFKAGNLDFIAGITGGADTDEATKYADDNPTKAAYIHYGRAGYGKLGFRADFGSVQFKEVRQALAYSMDRSQFALEFNGGYGGKVDGPYYAGSWMYQAVKNDIVLSSYDSSLESAVETLVAGGWIYDKNGNPYTSGVRYKKIPANEMNDKDIGYRAQSDASIKTEVIKGADGKVEAYLMPLVINWFGTAKNPFTTQVQNYLMKDDSIATKAGFKVCVNIGDFYPMLDELYQEKVYGYYGGTPMYNMFNYATGFNSAAYDYAYGLTIDPSMYDNYSQYYIKDEYDFYLMKKAA